MKNIKFLILVLISTNLFADNDRIVAIDGSITEILYSLGVGDKVVGRDLTSIYPPEAKKLPSVGYMRNLSIEGILSLRPNLVIATKDAKPQSVLLRLKQAGVSTLLIENDFSLKGVINKINFIADFLDKEKQGKTLSDKIKNETNIEIRRAHSIKDKFGIKKALFVLNMRGGNMMVAGSHTRANTMLKLAGLVNPAANEIKGYKPLNAEAVIRYNPDFIVSMQTTSKDKKSTLLKSSVINATSAGKNKNIIIMNDSFLSFGPRIGRSIKDLSTKVYADKS